MNPPIGFIVPGYGNKSGRLETAFVITKVEQRKGFGTQAVDAIMHKYLPALIANHYKIYGKPLLAQGAPANEIVATARLDNPASIRVMEKAGMKKRVKILIKRARYAAFIVISMKLSP